MGAVHAAQPIHRYLGKPIYICPICPREDAAAINNDYARELDARKRKVMIKQ
jgi:hypothetical protein